MSRTIKCSCGRIISTNKKTMNGNVFVSIDDTKRLIRENSRKFKNVFRCKICRRVVVFEMRSGLFRVDFNLVNNGNRFKKKRNTRYRSRGSRSFNRGFKKRKGRKSSENVPFNRNLFKNDYFFEKDLKFLKSKIREKGKVDPMQFICEKTKFFKNVLNHDNVETFGKDFVNSILIIINFAFSNSISSPKLFLSHFVRTKFFTVGLEVYIRSSYFTSIQEIRVVCEFFQFVMKFSHENVSKLPFEFFEKVFEPYMDDCSPIQDVIDAKHMLESKKIVTELSDEKIDEFLPFDEIKDGDEFFENKSDSCVFRFEKVVPTKQDFNGDYNPNTLPPKITDYWNNEKKYLQAHYKLIKEDFLRPIKEGFFSYLKMKKDEFDDSKPNDEKHRHDFRDLQVFFDVKFLFYTAESNNQFELVFKFRLPTRKRKSYRQNKLSLKALMRNSLVVLFPDGKDEFDPIVCIVSSNEQLQNFKVSLTPYSREDFVKIQSELDKGTTYLMIESPVFFSAYESVLKSLQEKELIPFKEIIVMGDKEKNTPPDYIINNPKLKFSSISKIENIKIKKEQMEKEHREKHPEEENENEDFLITSNVEEKFVQGNIDYKNLVIQNCLGDEWIDTKYTILNESENLCLKNVFRNKFSLIQGGTGKTYIGRKIVEIMKENRNIPSPIVVICYTNHALDSFCEPLLNSVPKLVRVGTRTKSTSFKYLNRQMKKLFKNRINSYFSRKDQNVLQLKRVIQDLRNLCSEIEKISFFRFDVKTIRDLFDVKGDSKYRLGIFSNVIKEYAKYLDSGSEQCSSNQKKRKMILNQWLNGKNLEDLIIAKKKLILKERKKVAKKKRREWEKRRKREEREKAEKRRIEKERLKKISEERNKAEKRRIEKERLKKISEIANEKKRSENIEKGKLRKAEKGEIVKKSAKVGVKKLFRQIKVRMKGIFDKKQDKKTKKAKKKLEITSDYKNEKVVMEKKSPNSKIFKKWENEEFGVREIQEMKNKFQTFENDIIKKNEFVKDEKEELEEEGEEGEIESDEDFEFGDEDSDDEIIENTNLVNPSENNVKSTKIESFTVEEKNIDSDDVNRVIDNSKNVKLEDQTQQTSLVKIVETKNEESEIIEIEPQEENPPEPLYIEHPDENIDVEEELIKEREKIENLRREIISDTEIDLNDFPEFIENNNRGFSSKVIVEYLKFVQQKLTKTPWSLKNRKKIMEKILFDFKKLLCGRENDLYKKYEDLQEKKKECALKIELDILQSADLIGMTSTMASIRRRLLRRLNPPIVIFEEAAEVLEGQIISSLPEKAQHVILIGDKKQLKPKYNSFVLEKCNIDVSLFERMDKIGVSPESLKTQQRMRPEISYIMKELYYPHMIDHESVMKYPDVCGHNFNLQFIKHNEPETQSKKSRSKFNHFEANFVVNHVLYLLKHRKYGTKDITILTPYKGQMFLIRRRIRELVVKNNQEEFKKLRVETVDDFQGEENDIILVSLVRSSTKFKRKKDQIGFLKIQNRIIVLMSRAKHGCFIYGNANLLKNRSGDWEKILYILEKQNKVHDFLYLKCENHPTNVRKIYHPSDFKSFKCEEKCGKVFPCEHVCSKKCHFDKHKCKEKCKKTIECGHQCREICHYGSDCFCSVPKEHVFVGCLHSRKIRCGDDLLKIKCMKWVPFKLPCNHESKKRCHEKIEDLPENVKVCKKKCGKVLPCGHVCKKKCSTCARQVEHKECNQKVKIRCCKCLTEQSKKCKENLICRGKCRTLMMCSHQCKLDCSACTGDHKCLRRCCRIRLCGHSCTGNHKCGSNCYKCRQYCPFICSHGFKCGRFCGEDCFSCRGKRICCHNLEQRNCRRCKKDLSKNNRRNRSEFVKCGNRCPHRSCSKKCFEICNVEPCHSRCRKFLPCGHRCFGFCGEQCPPCVFRYCRGDYSDFRCNITGETLGEFLHPVYILPCGCEFFAANLDNYMLSADENMIKECPGCGKGIYDVSRCKRYERVIKLSIYCYNNLKRIAEKKKKKVGLNCNSKIFDDFQRRIKKYITSDGKRIIDYVKKMEYQQKQDHGSLDFGLDIDKFVLVMNKFLVLSKSFYFETGVIRDVNFHLKELLKVYLKECETKESTNIAHVLVKLIHSKLVGGNEINIKRKTIEHEVKKILEYFVLIDDKDFFFNFYQNYLGFRLLHKSSSVDDEKWAINLINKSSNVFRNQKKDFKLLTMLKDLAVSSDLKKEAGLKDFNVKVISQKVWPITIFQDNIPIPRFVMDNSKKFEDFYKKKFPERNLKWIYQGTNSVILKCVFMNCCLEIKVNGCQAIILLQFNNSNEYSFEELKEITKINDIGKYLLTLVSKKSTRKRGKILLWEKKKMYLNDNFRSAKRRLELLSPNLNRTEVKSLNYKTLLERKVVINAAIMRIMKKQKELEEAQLIQLVRREIKLFTASVFGITKQISELCFKNGFLRKESSRIFYVA